MFFKALMTVEGIGKQVSPNLDLISECKPYVEALVSERYGQSADGSSRARVLN